MTIMHHPGEEHLVAYASGAANEAVALVIATHLALCPQCRRVVASVEGMGGAMLNDLVPTSMGDGSLTNVLSRLSEAVPQSPPPRRQSSWPEPLRSYVGDDVKWIGITKGLSYRPILKRGKTRVQMIRSLPGAGVGAHTHRGEELTLVLEGGFTDITGHYLPGDLQTADPLVTHRPLADEGGPCVTLAVTNASLRFDSRIVGAFAKLFGF